MRPLWHPLSTILLAGPSVYATKGVLEVLLRSASGLDLIYAGDRMWPTLSHGESIRVRPYGEAVPRAGDVVLACPDGIPDALRVEGKGEASRWTLRGDADPAESFLVDPDQVLGRVETSRLVCSRAQRAARRCFLDLREAIVGEARPPEGDTSETVRLKYESQAPFYAAARIPEIDPALLEWMRRRLPADGPVLVAGSGTGRECMALARTGREVTGVDFSAEMVRQARESAGAEGVRIRYLCEDLRSHREQAGSLAGILFTYEVYSFLPRKEDRIRLLERMRNWLAPGGALFLSARRVTRVYDRLLLSVHWLVKGRRAGRVWGDTHTRYIGPDGVLHRSFVHAFTERGLRREAREAGLREEEWREGHGVWSPK